MRSWVIASGFASTAVLIGVTSAGGCGGSEDVDRSSASGTTSGPGSGGHGEGGAGVAGSEQGGEGGEACVPEDFESCDGVDNTCEGDIDEGCDCVLGDREECFSADPELIGVGVCVAGTRVCDATGQWSDCDGEVLPGAEICNLKDDDCDGAVDEDQGLETCGQGNCTVTVESCVDGVEQECIPLTPGAYYFGGKFKGGSTGNFWRVRFFTGANCTGNNENVFDFFLTGYTDWQAAWQSFTVPAGTVSANVYFLGLGQYFDQMYINTVNQF